MHNQIKSKLNINNLVLTDSPKINLLLDKKGYVEPRSSLLEGMKGVVNIKNSQILKINYDSANPKFSEKRKQSTKKSIDIKSHLEASTSLSENKIDSE